MKKGIKKSFISLVVVGVVIYLLSRITVAPPEKDETAYCDDGSYCFSVIEKASGAALYR